jgi:penicillin-binding protein 2
VSVTPVALAATYASVANGGTRVRPHLLRAIDSGTGWQSMPVASYDVPAVRLKPETVSALHDGLWMVVNGAGTGRNSRLDGHDVSGKTGTAQVISLQGGKAAAGKTDRDLRDHGWFAFFAPRDNPEISGVVFAEHSLHGSEAARVARHVLDTYFAKKAGRPLPVFVPPVKPPEAPAEAQARPRTPVRPTAAPVPVAAQRPARPVQR